ncbi:hypothetical protein Sesv_4151 [Salmonella enterica subsp. enterica serovar Virchow str. SVQ1]|nr:hypothetical protein Sesv_4151 [Salmonella enterica subsp. enterica serovar Virchow str. SVQ1]
MNIFNVFIARSVITVINDLHQKCAFQRHVFLGSKL